MNLPVSKDLKAFKASLTEYPKKITLKAILHDYC